MKLYYLNLFVQTIRFLSLLSKVVKKKSYYKIYMTHNSSVAIFAVWPK